MSIQDVFNKINPKREENGLNNEVPDIETVSFDDNGEIRSNSLAKRLFLPMALILILTLAFGLGRLSKSNSRAPLMIEYDSNYSTTTSTYGGASKVEANTVPKEAPVNSSEVVGSIKGTKYHYLYCPGAKQISPANKITFTNAAAAEAAGYTLALNCKPR